MGGTFNVPGHNLDLRNRGEERSVNLAGTLILDPLSGLSPTDLSAVDRGLD
jgi:hypothetical protein